MPAPVLMHKGFGLTPWRVRGRQREAPLRGLADEVPQNLSAHQCRRGTSHVFILGRGVVAVIVCDYFVCCYLFAY